MTQKAWAAVVVLGALVVVMVVTAIKVLPTHHHHSSNAAHQQSTGDGGGQQAAPPPPASKSPEQSATADGGTVLGSDDVDAAHQVMVSYLQSLGSYTSADRQDSWQRDALSFTDGSTAIRSFTHLPTGRAWADCQHTHCASQSKARIIRDTSTSNIAGSGGAPQIVSYVDLTTTLTGQGSKPDVQHTQFSVTATEGDSGWKVAGCTFAGVGDAGANGDGP